MQNVDNLEVVALTPLFFPQPMLNHYIMINIIIYIGTLTLVTHLQYVVCRETEKECVCV